MTHSLRFFLQEKYLVPLTFLLIGIAGALSFTDYGVSADEPAIKAYGEQVFDYLSGGAVPEAYDWQFYGPIWPLFLISVTRMLHVQFIQTFWEIRHFLSFALFFTGLIFFYKLGKIFFKDWRYALLGIVFLVLSPRVFAHAFYNPKDSPAMVFFILSTWSLVTFLRTRTIPMLLVHSLFCAILVSMRMVGLLIPLLTLMFVLGTKRHRTSLAVSAGFLLTFCLCLYAIWPYLWTDPVNHFLHALLNSGTRSGGGFYFGQMVGGPMLSAALWHYLPVWMAITIPPLYTVLFLIGFCVLGMQLVHSLRTQPKEFLVQRQTDIILFLWFLFPIVLLYASGAGIFDEWRHMLFLYPAFLLIALFGLHFLLTAVSHPLFRKSVLAVTACSVLWTGLWMVRFHPLEFGYFSIPASWVKGNFEMDYWGLSYREGWKWLLANHPSPALYVFSRTSAGEKAVETLSADELKRIYFVPVQEAEYVLDNFREDQYKIIPPDSHLAHMINADGVPLLGIYHGPNMVKVPANL